MPRTVKPEAFAAKRHKILEAAQHLIFTKGYEQTAIRDILNTLQVSSGAFHHYFDSRESLLAALTEHIQSSVEKRLLPIIKHPTKNAIQKLQGYFDILDRSRIAQKTVVVELLRVWYSDENAVVRQKVAESMLERRAPLLTTIVRQGVLEGVFTTAFPDSAGEIILSLLQGMDVTQAKRLLSLSNEHDEKSVIAEIVTTHAAYMDAVERVLGAPTKTFHRNNRKAVQEWVTALKIDAANTARS
jgi:AcrR family transcriptional regulator